MEKNKEDEIIFHRFSLRIPEELYKIIEDMAWESRTSVNIKMMDMIFYAFYLIFQETSLKIDQDAYILTLKNKDVGRFNKMFKEKKKELFKRIKEVRKKYEIWRENQ